LAACLAGVNPSHQTFQLRPVQHRLGPARPCRPGCSRSALVTNSSGWVENDFCMEKKYQLQSKQGIPELCRGLTLLLIPIMFPTIDAGLRCMATDVERHNWAIILYKTTQYKRSWTCMNTTIADTTPEVFKSRCCMNSCYAFPHLCKYPRISTRASGHPAICVCWSFQTPQWHLNDAFRFAFEISKDAPASQQEQTYTTPIWYAPS
jgi:hypothetical protein